MVSILVSIPLRAPATWNEGGKEGEEEGRREKKREEEGRRGKRRKEEITLDNHLLVHQ